MSKYVIICLNQSLSVCVSARSKNRNKLWPHAPPSNSRTMILFILPSSFPTASGGPGHAASQPKPPPYCQQAHQHLCKLFDSKLVLRTSLDDFVLRTSKPHITSLLFLRSLTLVAQASASLRFSQLWLVASVSDAPSASDLNGSYATCLQALNSTTAKDEERARASFTKPFHEALSIKPWSPMVFTLQFG